MKPKVLLPYDEERVASVQEILGDLAVVVSSQRTAESMLEKGGDAVVVASGRVPAEFIRKAKNLRMIQALSAGVDKIDREAVLERGALIVCNNPMNAEEVAEYAIMLLLAAAKNIIVNDRALRKGDWTYGFGGPRPNVELRRKTCLILGLGNIGVAIAQRLKGFDLRIIGATRTGVNNYPAIVETVASVDKMGPLVREADFVVLALPLTQSSRGIVDAKFISWMKNTSILVNVSRGEIIEESALYHALQEHRILAAALDVWWRYPQWEEGAKDFQPSNYPLHQLDNVVMSPHRAAYSKAVAKAHLQFAGQNILRFLQGKEPQNIVDMDLGY
ncbi:MAG: hypothetical protein EAX95_01020 [Candidatus Thorarchaeota archaeon]|nr:hypothetical protein [Candidatus Thorarchaeota archaeon]